MFVFILSLRGIGVFCPRYPCAHSASSPTCQTSISFLRDHVWTDKLTGCNIGNIGRGLEISNAPTRPAIRPANSPRTDPQNKPASSPRTDPHTDPRQIHRKEVRLDIIFLCSIDREKTQARNGTEHLSSQWPPSATRPHRWPRPCRRRWPKFLQWARPRSRDRAR